MGHVTASRDGGTTNHSGQPSPQWNSPGTALEVLDTLVYHTGTGQPPQVLRHMNGGGYDSVS